jgi:hypothetical protein
MLQFLFRNKFINHFRSPVVNTKHKDTQSNPFVSLETYTDLVNRCAMYRLNHPIANGSAFHARILIRKLFELAQKEVRIFSGALQDVSNKGVEVYAHPPLFKEAKRFLKDPNSTLTIIVQSGEIFRGKQNRFLNEIVNDPDRNAVISIYLPKPAVLDQSYPHFMVADRSLYRVETGEKAIPDDESISAVANFGDSASGNNLAELFTEMTELLTSESNLREKIIYNAGQTLD